MKWWEKPVRMMRLDYISDLVRMKEADLDALARSKRDDWNINCEWVIGTPGIAPGLADKVTFNTPKFEKYEALGDFDLIREYLPHARRYGIKVLAYLNMHWFSYAFADQHSNWEQKIVDGRSYGRVRPLYGGGTTLCVNTPWAQWAWELIEEAMKTGIDGVFLDGPVIYPGCCYCDSCKAKFQERYGVQIPVEEDWFDDAWKNFIEFREESMADFLKGAKEAVEGVNPEGVVFLNAGSWHGGGWRVARNMEKVGDYQHFNGAESFFHPGSTTGVKSMLEWALTAKHLVAGGKPAVVFSHHTLGAWHYIPLAPIEAKLAVAQTVACGANPWIAVFDYALDHSKEEAIAPIKGVNGFLSANEEYYTGTRSGAKVGLLFSSQNNVFYLSELDDMYGDVASGVEKDLGVALTSGKIARDWKKRKAICDNIVGSEFYGWSLMLSRAHIPYDVILDKDLNPQDLADYDLIVLPNSACLSQDQLDVLRDFVENGGALIATFETGRYDDKGVRHTRDLSDLLGIEEVEGAMGTGVAEEYLKAVAPMGSIRNGQFLPRPAYSLKVREQDGTHVLAKFLESTGRVYLAPKGESCYPGLILREYGKGKVAYLASLLGNSYTTLKIEDHELLARYMVEQVRNGESEITVEAPPTVQVELRKQVRDGKERILIHLVNNTGDMQRPMTTLIPIYDIRVKIPKADASSVRTLWSKEGLAFMQSGDVIEFTLPRLEFYEVVVIE